MSRVFELAFELSGRINNSVRSSFSGLNREVNTLNSRISQMERSRGDISRFRGLRTDIINTNREFNTAQETVNRLGREMRNTTNPSRQLQNEFERARRNASNLNGRLREQRTELGQVRERLDQAGISTRNLSGEQTRLERTIQRTTQAQAQYTSSREQLDGARAQTAAARGRLVDAVAIGATLAVPVKLAIDAENTMADIKKVVDFDSEVEFKNMEKTIMNISKNIPMSFNEIGEIIAAGGQSGIDKIDLPQFSVNSAKMGIAFDIEAGEAGQTMAEWRAAFKMNQAEVNVLADKINYLGNTTAASAPKISEIVSRIGPLGEVGGVASGEIAALGATLVGMGVGEEIAATGIKNLMLTMNKGTAASKKQKAVYKDLGLSSEKMAKKMQTDSNGAILELLNALKKVPEHARAAKLEQLVGKESIAAIAPLLGNIQELEKNFDSVNEAQKKFSGSMEAEFQARAATTENSVILLKNQFQNMGITLGTVLLPPIVELATKLGSVAGKVQEFSEKYPELTSNIVKLTATVMAFTVAFLAVSYVFALLKQGFIALKLGWAALKLIFVEGKIQAIGSAIATKALSLAQLAQAGVTKTVAVAQGALNAVMSANPIALVIIAIVALVAGLALLYNKSEAARVLMDKLWNGLKDGTLKAFGAISEGYNKLTNLFKKPIKGEVNISNNASAGKASKNLPAYAKGGIVHSPQIALIGEGRASEAIIPLEKTANSMSLWEKAGRALGVDMSPKGIDIASSHVKGKGSTINTNNSGEDKYEFNFNIDAKGSIPGMEDLIKDKLLQEVIPVVMRLLKEKERDKLRVQIN